MLQWAKSCFACPPKGITVLYKQKSSTSSLEAARPTSESALPIMDMRVFLSASCPLTKLGRLL